MNGIIVVIGAVFIFALIIIFMMITLIKGNKKKIQLWQQSWQNATSCDVCGAEFDAVNPEKHALSSGFICNKCFLSLSSKGVVDVSKMTSDSIKNLIAFNTNKIIGALHIDDNNKKWYISRTLMPGLTKPGIIHNFSEIESSEIIEDGGTIETVKKSGLGRAVVGGMLFGGAGAIVGGVTGKSKGVTKPFVNNMSIRIQLKGGVGSVSHELISTQTPTSSPAYKNAIEQAKNIVSAIESMINAEAEIYEPDNISNNNISVADELAKFKKLLDDGILTQEEFDKKKQHLLDI